MTTKLRAMMILTTTDQVAAVIEFARTLDIQLDMGAVQEAPKEQYVGMGNAPPRKEHQVFLKHAKEILGATVRVRAELVRELAKRVKKDPKRIGMAVKAMIADGVLEVR